MKQPSIRNTIQTYVASLATSQEWELLKSELERASGGGACVVAYAQHLMTDPCVGIDDGNNVDRCVRSTRHRYKQRCMTLQEIAWEKLHSGLWSAVPVVWRNLYSLACILKFAADEDNDDNVDPLRLRNLDMAILMGGPLFRPLIDTLIDAEMQSITTTRIDTTTTTWNSFIIDDLVRLSHQHQPSILPPNSLLSTGLGHPGRTVQAQHCLSVDRFAAEYMATSTPVVITGAMDAWSALSTWKDIGYLKSVAGSRTVPIEVGRNYALDPGWTQTVMNFSEFLDSHFLVWPWKEDPTKDSCIPIPHYLAQHDVLHQIPALKKDVVPPYEYTSVSSSNDENDDGNDDVVCNMWIGPAGTVTPPHTDPYHNLLCQVVGRKYVRLYAPDHTPALYPVKDKGHRHESEGVLGRRAVGLTDLMTNTSRVDVDNPDVKVYPLFPEAPFLEYVLEPGMMMFIPQGWWHYVKALSPSISVNFWWK